MKNPKNRVIASGSGVVVKKKDPKIQRIRVVQEPEKSDNKGTAPKK